MTLVPGLVVVTLPLSIRLMANEPLAVITLLLSSMLALAPLENTPVEFGCIDIVHDGRDQHYIIDLNLTPYAGTRAHDAYLTDFLRMGITDPHKRKRAVSIRTPLA